MNILYKLLLLDGGESSDGNAPVNTVPPTISGTLVVGSVLTTTNGTWTSDTGIIPPYTYQWKRGVTNIGTDANTYTLVTADAGQNITCVVTACDSDGCTPATSNSVYIIDAEAQAHYDRVIADGGTIPLGLTALNEFIVSVKNNYSVASVNTAMWALKPHWGISGIKTASGTGATAGGRATSVLYDICGVNGDFIQTTASAQPLALVHSGSSADNYWYGSGVVGNLVTTATTISPTTQVDVVAYLIASPTHGNSLTIISNDGAARNFIFNCSNVASGILQLRAGTPLTSFSSTVGVGDINNYTGWVRATYNQNGANGEVTFYTSNDSKNTAYSSINWTQLGGVVISASTSLQTGISAIQLGANQGTGNFSGIIGRATIATTIGGAPVVDFNPASYNRATSQTSWVSATGETWTLNTASTNNALKACIVDQTMIMGNGTSYGMRAPSLNINDTAITSYTVFRKFVTTNLAQVINELSTTIDSNNGKYLRINDGLGRDRIAIRADVGVYDSFYNNTELGLSIATAINNISNVNESSPYFINNSARTFVLSVNTNNNTTAMNGTGYNFLARNNASILWANVIATGDIVVKGEDDSTKMTAMYNLLKTLSNI